jgi:hypothetical protein
VDGEVGDLETGHGGWILLGVGKEQVSAAIRRRRCLCGVQRRVLLGIVEETRSCTLSKSIAGWLGLLEPGGGAGSTGPAGPPPSSHVVSGRRTAETPGLGSRPPNGQI